MSSEIRTLLSSVHARDLSRKPVREKRKRDMERAKERRLDAKLSIEMLRRRRSSPSLSRLPRSLLTPKPETPTKQPIISLDAQDTVAQALSTLSRAKILSAPLVVGGPPSLAFEGKPPVAAVAAFVGVADVLDALLDSLPFEEAEGRFDAPLPTDVERAGAALCERTLGEVFGASSARGAAASLEKMPSSTKLGDEAGTDWVLKKDSEAEPLTLLSAITDGFLWPLRVVATGKGKKESVHGGPQRACHRIALFNDDRRGEKKAEAPHAHAAARLTGLLSQSDALAWLVEASASSPALRKVLEDTPAAPGGGESGGASYSRVLTVPATATALAAFRAMRSAGVSAAAVVEEGSGVLLGSLSASDARYLRAGLFGALCVPCTTFLAERPLLAAAARAAEQEERDSSGDAEAELARAVEEACKEGAAMAGALGGGVPAPTAVGSGRVVSVGQFEEGGAPNSLGAAAAKMVKERVHRCWVVSEKTGVVAGCVTATDVLLSVQRAVESEE